MPVRGEGGLRWRGGRKGEWREQTEGGSEGREWRERVEGGRGWKEGGENGWGGSLLMFNVNCCLSLTGSSIDQVKHTHRFAAILTLTRGVMTIAAALNEQQHNEDLHMHYNFQLAPKERHYTRSRGGHIMLNLRRSIS